MPPFELLGDAAIAAVVNYVRGGLAGTGASVSEGALDASAITKLRASNLSAAEVHAYRAKLAPQPR